MSTFSNTPDVPAMTAGTAFQVTPQDDVIVNRFREASSAAIRKLNTDLHLQLDEPRFKWLQTYFANVAKRDPTAGELRLLNALDHAGQSAPDRVVVGELYTDSATLADTWADMMSKHHALHGRSVGGGRQGRDESAPPCSLSEVLTLAGDYLYRTGVALPPTDGGEKAEGRTVVLSAPWQEAEAAAAGYRPVARILTDGGETRTVCVRHGRALNGAPERAGDFLLYLHHAELHKVVALVDGEREKSHPALGDIRAVQHTSVLLTVLRLCTAADIYADRLVGGNPPSSGTGHLPLASLCEYRASNGTAADFILRVPMKQVHALSEALHGQGLTAMVIGQVRANERTVIHMRSATGTQDIPVVNLPSAFLRETAAVRLYRYHLSDGDVPGSGSTVQSVPVSRLPLVESGEDGLTPNGHETVALTALKDGVLRIPEADLLLHTVTTVITAEGAGYTAAMNAVLAALAELTAVGVDRSAITLSVSLTAGDRADRPGSMTLAALCGLYRASAELAIPVADPTMAVGRTPALDRLVGDAPAVSLTVTAWARSHTACERAAHPTRRLTAPDRRLFLLFAEPAEDGLPAMDETRVLTDYVASLAAADTPPSTILPLYGSGLTVADTPALAETDTVAADLFPACQELLTRHMALAYLVESDVPLRGMEIGRTTARPFHAENTEPSQEPPTDDRQWSAATHPVDKESPGYLFPVLRRSYEGSLRALSAALSHDRGARCIIRPVVINTVTVEVPVETTEDARMEMGAEASVETSATVPPRTETREVLDPDSVRALADELLHWNTPVFAMSEADTRLLLGEPAVREALEKLVDMGYPAIALNESCKPLAELGFLPEALTELTTVPTAAPTVVSYAFGAPEAIRLVRRDLLTPAGELPADASHLLTLRTAEGNAVPDGFVGRGGRVLGLLNGLDATTVALCGKHDLDPFKSTHTKGNPTMNTLFEALKQTPRAVILDTDIGPDCDDVGALVTLIHYAKQYGYPIAGICNCTSNKAGTGTIDAVCRHCGIETPALGQWSKPDFMDDPSCHKYNDAVAEKFSEGYRNGTLKVEDEVTFYRRLLANAADDGVMLISIGMFNDLAALMQSPADAYSPLSGMELIKAKVHCLVSMAAILPQGRECNVISDYKAAEAVLTGWPTPIFLSDFHIGYNMMTGYDHITDPEQVAASPLSLAYHLYTKDWTHIPTKGCNSSFDLTAVQFAAEGEGELYGLGEPGRLEFYAEIPELPDATRFIPDPAGNCRFMFKKVDNQVIADSLNGILRNY